MKARDLVFIFIVVTVIGGLYYLSTKNKAVPMSSRVSEHTTAKTRNDCLKCHLPETMSTLERQHKHPGKWKDVKVDCTRCHTLQKQ